MSHGSRTFAVLTHALKTAGGGSAVEAASARAATRRVAASAGRAARRARRGDCAVAAGEAVAARIETAAIVLGFRRAPFRVEWDAK